MQPNKSDTIWTGLFVYTPKRISLDIFPFCKGEGGWFVTGYKKIFICLTVDLFLYRIYSSLLLQIVKKIRLNLSIWLLRFYFYWYYITGSNFNQSGSSIVIHFSPYEKYQFWVIKSKPKISNPQNFNPQNLQPTLLLQNGTDISIKVIFAKLKNRRLDIYRASCTS